MDARAEMKPRMSPAQRNVARHMPQATERKRALKRKPTKAELAFRKLLQDMRINHQFQKLVFTARRYFIMDFVIKMGPNQPHFIIEIDGEIHDRQRDYDALRTYLIQHTATYRSFTVMRLTNAQVFNGEALEFLKRHYPRSWHRYQRRLRNPAPPATPQRTNSRARA